MSPRRTRAKNATTHPGAIVLMAQGKRQTKAEKQADDNRVAAERATAEKAEQERVITIAKMVMELRAKGESTAAPESQASGGKGARTSPNSASGTQAIEKGNKNQIPSETQVTAPTTDTKPRKAPKVSLKTMINEARKTIDDSNGDVSDKKPNLSQYLPKKQSLSGTVKGWAALVHEKTSQGSVKALSDTQSTLVSTFSSQPSQAMTTSTQASTTQCSETSAGIVTQFGGFDLDCSDDDKEQMMPWKGKGRSYKDDLTVIPSVSDSDPEIEASQIPPWYEYPSTPRVLSGVIKRKIEEVPDSEPEDKEAVENGMQIDTDMVHEARTTASTSVGIIHEDGAQPALKKTKTEPDADETITITANDGQKTRTTGATNRSRSDYKNSDLPVPADQRWTNTFMDTVVLWAGGQSSIWSIPDETLAAALEEIFSTVYTDVQYKVTIHSAVFGVVSQRLLEWRSGFGSTALVMVIHFFWEIIKDAKESEGSNATIREIAGHLVSPPHFPFTHEDCDSLDPTRNFRSDFILKLVATAHLSKTLGAVNVPSLGIAKLQRGHGMESVIALAAAALERAFTLVRDGIIDIRSAVKEMAEKKGKITLPKTLNKRTGNMSKGTSMFSMSNWGSETQSYTTALVKKGTENTADIIESACTLLDRAPADSSSFDTDTVDPRSLLWYLFRNRVCMELINVL